MLFRASLTGWKLAGVGVLSARFLWLRTRVGRVKSLRNRWDRGWKMEFRDNFTVLHFPPRLNSLFSRPGQIRYGQFRVLPFNLQLRFDGFHRAFQFG